MLSRGLVSVVVAADIPEVEPRLDAPWIDNALMPILGWLLATATVLLVGGVIAAALTWGLSKVFSADRLASNAIVAVVVCLIAAILVVSARGLIQWATGIQMF